MKYMLCILLSLTMICCMLTGAEGEVGGFFINDSQSFDIQIGTATEILGSFIVTPLSFTFEDSLGFYQPGRTDVGSNNDYYHSGKEAKFAVLKVDIDNTSSTMCNYLDECEIRAYDGVNTYGGWAFQQNYGNAISADLSYGKDSERQNVNWVISAEDVYGIEPTSRGHYVFGCTLPNEIADGNMAVRMEITVKSTKFIFNIRQDGSAVNVETQDNSSSEQTDLTGMPEFSVDIVDDAAVVATPALEYNTVYFDALSKGNKGGKVTSLQKALIELGYLSGSADGDYGKKTEAAVQSAQVQAGLAATGVADNVFLTELYAGRIPDAMGTYIQLAPQIVDYSETSHHTEKAGAYTVSNVFDGKTYTCWAEGASGYGIGEGISFTVATFGRSSITLNIYSGYHKSSQRYHQNGRPKNITLYVNGIPQTHTFTDVMVPEAITIHGIEGSPFVEFEITIDSVYNGSKWSDTCISEIEIY